MGIEERLTQTLDHVVVAFELTVHVKRVDHPHGTRVSHFTIQPPYPFIEDEGILVVILTGAHSKLLETIAELEDSISGYRGDLKRIQGAIAALQQKPKKKRKAPSKPSASKADVESALMGAKDSNPEANDEELRAIAEKQLVDQGFSRSGLALRFKQVTSQFESKEAITD